MAQLQLLSTDFDGTLIGHPSDGRCSGAFAEVLNEHRHERGLWAVNTGRGLPHAIEGLEIFGAPTYPDFLLTNEREVFRRTGTGGWEAHGEWNARCSDVHDRIYETARALFDEIEGTMGRRHGVRVIYESLRPAGLVTEDEVLMDEVVQDLRRMASSFAEFSFQRNTIYLRFCHADYDKGSALAELCRLEGLGSEAVFAAGDHYNDLSMLHPSRATHLACPSNAIPAVKAAVLAGGGIVASKPFACGVAEAILACKQRLQPAAHASQVPMPVGQSRLGESC